MPNKDKNTKDKRFKSLEEALRSRLAELQKHVSQLRSEMLIDDEVDDEATQAIRSTHRDMVMLTMEREIRNVSEIEQALERINKNVYGVCVACQEDIPFNRMRAIPWTRLCVDCAGGGMKRNNGERGLLNNPVLGSSLG